MKQMNPEIQAARPSQAWQTRASSKTVWFALAMSALFLASPGAAQQRVSSPAAQAILKEPSPEKQTMKIQLTINGKTTTATLISSPTVRAFVALLPMTLTMEDYASTEKIAYLPSKLSTQDAPSGIDPDVGDIAYYAPWGNLAIFYRDFGYSTGLIRLGRVDAGVEAFQVRGSLQVTIEAVPPPERR
mgnify:CR=1 FL=1